MYTYILLSGRKNDDLEFSGHSVQELFSVRSDIEDHLEG